MSIISEEGEIPLRTSLRGLDFEDDRSNIKEVHMTICPKSQRDAGILYDLISEHVELTSTIHIDCWRDYNDLITDGFVPI